MAQKMFGTGIRPGFTRLGDRMDEFQISRSAKVGLCIINLIESAANLFTKPVDRFCDWLIAKYRDETDNKQ
jgi:hypothetical protein